MPRGTPIPPHIRDFIVRTADNAPGLTAQEIGDKVKARFRTDYDSSSIGRIRREYAMGWRAARERTDHAAHTRSDHDQKAVNSPDVHMNDLLGWVWSTMEQIETSRSSVWYLDYHLEHQSDSSEDFLKEQSLLRESLRQHLPEHRLWDQLDLLQSAAEMRVDSIKSLEHAAAHEGVKLFHASISTEGPRLTTSFAPAVRSRVLCQSGEVGNSSDGFHLAWQKPGELTVDSNTYVTSHIDIDEQEAIDRFGQVVESVTSGPETATAISSIGSADEAAKSASDSLEKIYYRRRVPGRCDLCDPDAD